MTGKLRVWNRLKMVNQIKDLSLHQIESLLKPQSGTIKILPVDMNKIKAAVLIPFIRDNDEWRIIFIRRTESVQHHKGQVAFPGGMIEPADKNSVDTALRESQEEIGLNPKDVRVLGQLEPVVSSTNYIITPVVGIIPWPYKFYRSAEEVSRIFSVPLEWLAKETHREEKWLELDGELKRRVIYFQEYDKETLWGISAYITVNLLKKLKLN